MKNEDLEYFDCEEKICILPKRIVLKRKVDILPKNPELKENETKP